MCVVKQNIILILEYQNREYQFSQPDTQKESAAFQLRIHTLSPLPSIHLPLIMSPDAPYRLTQSVCPAVQMISNPPRPVRMMRMEYDHRPLFRILRIIQIPVMAGVAAHDRHIIGIRGNDGEIPRIQAF